MDSESLQLTIVTPRRQMLASDAAWVDVPAESGWMRVLPGHAATLGALGAGLLRYQAQGGGEAKVVVAGGFFEIRDNQVTLLADLAELPKDVNAAAAQAELAQINPATADPEVVSLAQARVEASR